MTDDTGQNLTHLFTTEVNYTSTTPQLNTTQHIQLSDVMTTVLSNVTGNLTGNLDNTTLEMGDPCEVVSSQKSMEGTEFYIGLSLALSSSLFIGSSFIFKKLGLLKLAKNQGTRAGQGGYGYLKEWLWWSGMILMITGEFANFAAYAFAPATLVTPLGALSVLVSAVLSSRFLNEKLNLLGKIGCTLCVLGSTVMVIHSPKEQEVNSMSCLLDKIEEPGFIIYCIFIVSLALFGIFFLAPRYAHKNVLVYVMICSTLGSFTVAGCKGLGVALKQTFNGDNQFTSWLTWILLAVVILCILVQLNYLNRALDQFNTSVVTPIYYVFFTSCVIVASLILFKEWGAIKAQDSIGNLCGFLVIIIGIFLLQAFKDMNISMANLTTMKREVEASNNGDIPTPVAYDQNFTDYHDDELGLLEEDTVSNGNSEIQLETEYRDDVEFR
ncbi:magnesium transporter NIPA2-like isoform X1 [Ylistrum balloti]|uniref:magnesium transporter NIPA2-like isoform X1 n=2 Tax=Ylistrum balloti TaxID=509963 RepID=UPI002905A144|nr:magnesium transporter NIPA2-like isoform X1 [Ylistrum balloti]